MTNILAGVITGSLVASSVFFGDAVSSSTNVPIGDAFGLAIGSCGIVWWVGKNFQALKDGQKFTNARLDRIETYLGIKFLAKQKEESTTTGLTP